MRYDIDSLFNSNIPEAIGLPALGSSALENIDPNTLGTGEVGNQLGNVGQAQALIVVKPNENIQKAIDKLHILGGGKVLLLNGTHIVNYDIQLYSSITLEGENSETAIIDFGGTSKQIKSIGTSVYSVGTVSVSNNGTTVTGSSTSWATNAIAGQYILLAGVWYPIAVVTNDTTITIAVPFADTALSGASYVICTPVQDMKIENLVVKNSAISAVKIQYANEFVLNNLNCQTSLVGVELDTTSQTVVDNIDCTANYTQYKFTNAHFIIMTGSSGVDSLSGHGMELNGMTNSAISSTFILNSASDGVNLVSCKNCRIDGVFVENAGSGMEFVSGNENIVVFNNRIEKNGADGVKLTATSDNIFIQSSFIKENTGYGVNIAASTCDNTVITGNNFSGNTTSAVNDSGTGTMIRGNVGVSDNSTSSLGSGVASDGSDGSYTLDGTQAAVSGLFSKSGNDYTLLRDAYFNNLTIDSGITLIPNGFRLFVKGTLTNNGTVTMAGGAGGNGGDGAPGSETNGTVAGGTAGAAGTAKSTNNLYGGVAGKAGGVGAGSTGGAVPGTPGAGTVGNTGAANNIGSNGVASGAGGNGGTSVSQSAAPSNGAASVAGGTKGTNAVTEPRNNIYVTYGFDIYSGLSPANSIYATGAGGGSGGGGGQGGRGITGGTGNFYIGGAGGGGGGSGANGGVMVIVATGIAGSGVFTCAGGNGGNGGNGGTHNGNGGGPGGGGAGGAGGNGGALLILVSNYSFSGTTTVAGGTGGTGGSPGAVQGGGDGAGTNGTNGTNGVAGMFVLLN